MRILAWLLAASIVLPTTALSVKETFFAYDPITHERHRQNFLWDDGGFYVAGLHSFAHRRWFEAQPWYREIRDHVSQDQLLRAWGQWAPRAQKLFTPHLYDAYFAVFVGFSRLTGRSLTDAYGFGLLLVPVFVALKYAVLLVLLPSTVLVPAMLGNIVIDLTQITTFHGSSAFAMPLFTLGLFLVLFTEARWTRGLGMSAMVMSCMFTTIPIAPTIALLLGVCWRRWPSGAFDRWWLPICLGCVGLIEVCAAVNAGVYLWQYRKPMGALRLFANVGENRYLAPGLMALLIGLFYAPPNPRILQIKRMTVWLLLGSTVYVALTPTLSYELRSEGGRFAIYVFAFLVTGLVARLESEWFRCRHLAIGAVAVLWVNAWLTLAVLTPARYIPFTERDFPSPEAGGFLARSPQQAYGYFIREDYLKGPLWLDLP